MMDLGRYDHALELLEGDTTPDGLDVRAEVYWKQQDWAGAAKIYEQRLGDRFKDVATPLSAADESRVIRAGVGYSLGHDLPALTRLSKNYLPFAAKARSAAAMRIALSGFDGMEGAVQTSDFGSLTAGADTFAGWVQTMKSDFRKQTGGNG